MRLSKPIMVLGVATTLSACATVPSLPPAPTPVAAPMLATERSLAGTAGTAWPAADWWRGFGDPALDQLIAEALAEAPDMAQAAARVRAAEAAAQQAGAALLPQGELRGSVSGVAQSRNMGIPPQFVPKGINDTGLLAGAASIDVDLWGRDRAALAAATSEAEAARVDADQARLLLTTAVAGAYADLASAFAQRAVAQAAVHVRTETAELTARRVAEGLDTRGELRQAEARVPAARADLAARDEAIALTRNRLAALLGKGPDRGLTIAAPQMHAPPLAVPEHLAAELIGRRPDIVAARLRSAAAANRIKVARADFYPNINLSAIVGLNALGLDQLFSSGSRYGSFGPALTLPIFSGGRLEGAYRGARADYNAAVARYDATLIAALHEVADALASLRAIDHQLDERQAALAAAREARAIARLRYEGGLANQLTVLAADDLTLAGEQAVADLEGRRRTGAIALVRALGGGFVSTPLNSDANPEGRR